jgi:hypothetical protein
MIETIMIEQRLPPAIAARDEAIEKARKKAARKRQEHAKTALDELWKPGKKERLKKKKFYFCMDAPDFVKCIDKEDGHDCWFKYTIWDRKIKKNVSRRRKIGTFSTIMTVGLSSSYFDKKSIVIGTDSNETRCYVRGDELTCSIPFKDVDKNKHPC